MSAEPASPRRIRHRALFVTGASLLSVHVVWRLIISPGRYFDPDELQHLHSAWCLSRGLLPYRDYFEHHTPLLHFLLPIFFPFFEVETHFAEAVSLITQARRLMILFAVGILFGTFWIARRIDGPRAGIVASVLLANCVMFVDKSVEIRPDVPASFFLVTSLCLMVSALRRSATWPFALGGTFLAVSTLFTQKAFFALPAPAAVMLAYLLSRRDEADAGWRTRRLAATIGGFSLPWALTLGYFAHHGALDDFFEWNFLFNLGFERSFPPHRLLDELRAQNPFFVSVALLGLLTESARLVRRRSFSLERLLLVSTLLSLVAGLLVLPVPYQQYALLYLPPGAVLAGIFLVRSADSLSEWLRRPREKLRPSSAWALGFLFLAVLSTQLIFAFPRASRLSPLLLGLLGLGVLVALLRIRRSPDEALAAVLLAASIYPFHQLWRPADNRQTLDAIRYTLEHTSPDDSVMDSFTGFGVFRPHAYFYFPLHREILQRLSFEERQRLLFDLRAGRVAPDLLVYDQNIRSLSPEIQSFFEENYEPAERPPFWKRKDIWLDPREGAPTRLNFGHDEADALAGPGWYGLEIEDGLDFRRSRGRRSWLRVPLREPRFLEVRLRARAELLDAPVEVELAVNGRRVGETALVPGWSDYRFRVPQRLTRRGVNRFLLTYSTTPARVHPGRSRKNTVLALDYLELAAAPSPP